MTQRGDFEKVRKHGRFRAGRFVVLSTLERPDLAYLKVGFITTRKMGNAVQRNLLRRRYRALVQKHGSELIDPKRFLVMIPRRGASEAVFSEIEDDWLKLARKLGLIE